MIRGEHTFIRGTEQDDVEALFQIYRPIPLRASLLDARREPLLPNRDDLGDLLTRKEISDGSFYTVEDRTGVIAGFCSLRGHNPEAGFAEYGLQLTDTTRYATPVADEAHAFLLDRGFLRMGLRKMVAHALASESALRSYLHRVGFTSAGLQREVLYAQGAWHDLETLVLMNPALPTTQR